MEIIEIANKNFTALQQNPYPGRGMFLGLGPDSKTLIQGYWIMGRSEGSRNRLFEPVPGKDGWVRTCIADTSKGSGGDLNLLIYPAVAEKPGVYVVSNGAQTEAMLDGGIYTLEREWAYEPDDPNFTPRITGAIYFTPEQEAEWILHIIRRSTFGDGCEHACYSYEEVGAGFGYCITTYMGDGTPLPSFRGEPMLVPIKSADPSEIATMYWDTLHNDNRVALVVKAIAPDGSSRIEIVNRYQMAT